MKKSIFISISLMVLVLLLSFGCSGTQKKSGVGKAQINISPNKGVPGTKIIIIGNGFIPQEKIKVILNVQNVQLQFGTSGTGGINKVSNEGTFKLEPAGGVPIAGSFVKPGIYIVEAIGDKGSFASTQLEVLKK